MLIRSLTMPNNQPTANSNLVINNHITDMLDDLPQSHFFKCKTLKTNDRLRQQMHEDLIDSYDEELGQMDDYIQDLRVWRAAVNRQPKNSSPYLF